MNIKKIDRNTLENYQLIEAPDGELLPRAEQVVSGEPVADLISHLRKCAGGNGEFTNRYLYDAANHIEAQDKRIAELESQLAEASKNAARYLHLKSKAHWEEDRDFGPGGSWSMHVRIKEAWKNKSMDDAIDRAMQGSAT